VDMYPYILYSSSSSTAPVLTAETVGEVWCRIC